MPEHTNPQTLIPDIRWSSDTSLFERALDCLPDGVLLIGGAKTIVYANKAFEKIWNVPDGIIQAKDDSFLLPWVAGQVVDTASFTGEVKRLYSSVERSEDIVQLKDGRIIARRSVPLREDGPVHTRIWIFTDVTEARQARIDTLTGLSNRLAYAKEYPAFVQAAGDGLVRAIAIMDIDNFKSYNDTYGHAAGDQVLRRIGAILRSRLTRPDDHVFRLGGEEFLIACKFRERSAATAFFDHLRRHVQSAQIEHAGNPPYNTVTSSFGAALFEGPKEPDIVFKTADAVLYQAKASGRNKALFEDVD